MTNINFCDGRRTNLRTPRSAFQCTSCGQNLPQKKRDWGLVWENKTEGICSNCLKQIRTQIGFKYLDACD